MSINYHLTVGVPSTSFSVNANAGNFAVSGTSALLKPSIAGGASASYDTSLQEGAIVTLSGTGLGTAMPTQILFEDFSGLSVQAHAETINIANINFDELANSPLVCGTESRSNTRCFNINGSRLNQLRMNSSFPSTCREIFVQYSTKIQNGGAMPGCASVGIDGISRVGGWKMSWLSKDGNTQWYDAGGTGTDIALPSLSAGSSLGVCDISNQPNAGLDGNTLAFRKLKPFWAVFPRTSAWYTQRIWLKSESNADGSSGDGGYAYDVFNGTTNDLDSASTGFNIWENDSHTAPQALRWWNYHVFSGYCDANGDCLYDDFLYNAGPNAAVHVCLGNAPTYAAATEIAACEIQTRTPTQVTAIVHEGPFDLSSGSYWFYFFDEDFNQVGTWAA